MTVLHATEAATVHLALWARTDGATVADVDRALYTDRSLVKQTAMRSTLFVFPRDLLPATWGSAAARAAGHVYRDLVKYVGAAGIAGDPDVLLADASAAVLDLLADGEPRTIAQLRAEVPVLDSRFTMGTPDKKWGGSFAIGRWVVGLLVARGQVVRVINDGHWQRNSPTWTRTEAWLDEVPTALPEAAGYAELVRRWLWTFGPGTEADIVWWLGATKTAVRGALADVGAEQVTLDGDVPAWVLPGDTEPVPSPEPWAALLPTLDPTVMGWKERGFYLDESHRPYLFDTNGNAGNTAWWDGRIVGAWTQGEDAVVRVLPRDDVGADATAALDAEAARLTQWLDGVRITNVYASRQMRAAALP